MKIGISLSIGAPPQTAALLAQAGFQVVGPQPGGDADAEFSVSFAPALADADQREQRMLVQCHGRDGGPRGGSILARGATESASFVVSRISGLAAPMLTADSRTYDAISRAMRAATRHLSLLIEGETGTGKKLLVRLFTR